MRLIYHPDAESELVEQHYITKAASRAWVFSFLNEADRAVATILKAPERWRTIEEGVRSYLMPRFP
jgi:hypothetical protein